MTPPPEPVQLESLDERLRNDLWNVLYSGLLNQYASSTPYSLKSFWWHFFGQPVEEYDARKVGYLIKTTVLEREWYEVYDLLEFIAAQTPDYYLDLLKTLNGVLELNRAGYRIVAGEVVEITDENELQSDGSGATSRFSGAHAHREGGAAVRRPRQPALRLRPWRLARASGSRQCPSRRSPSTRNPDWQR